MTSLATHQDNAIRHFNTIYHSNDPRDGVPALALDNLNSDGMRSTRRDLKAMMESGVEAFVLLGQNLSAAIHAQGDSRSKLIAKMACYLAWRAPSQRTPGWFNGGDGTITEFYQGRGAAYTGLSQALDGLLAGVSLDEIARVILDSLNLPHF